MAKKKNLGGRPRVEKPLGHVLSLRLSTEQYEQLVEAADGYPPATWARVELMRLVGKKRKGGKR